MMPFLKYRLAYVFASSRYSFYPVTTADLANGKINKLAGSIAVSGKQDGKQSFKNLLRLH